MGIVAVVDSLAILRQDSMWRQDGTDWDVPRKPDRFNLSGERWPSFALPRRNVRPRRRPPPSHLPEPKPSLSIRLQTSFVLFTLHIFELINRIHDARSPIERWIELIPLAESFDVLCIMVWVALTLLKLYFEFHLGFGRK